MFAQCLPPSMYFYQSEFCTFLGVYKKNHICFINFVLIQILGPSALAGAGADMIPPLERLALEKWQKVVESLIKCS